MLASHSEQWEDAVCDEHENGHLSATFNSGSPRNHQMQRIGYLIPEFPGQTHNFFWREIEALRELGLEVHLFSTRRPPATLESPSWAANAKRRTTYLFPPSLRESMAALVGFVFAGPRLWRRWLSLVVNAEAMPARGKIRMFGLVFIGVILHRKCKEFDLRHVHVHSCGDSANIALFANMLGSLDYSLTLHCAAAAFPQNQAAKWEHCKFGIVIADWILDDLRARLGARLPRELAVAPMGVNCDTFKRATPYKPHLAEEPLRLFCCARLNPGKGFPTLLEAVRLLKESGSAVTLTVAGEDDVGGTGYRMELERMITRLGIMSQVRLLGALAEEEVRKHLESAHIFVLASLQEGLGVAIMEAMAMELPVVATRVGGIPELVNDGISGVLVEPSNAAELVRVINEIAANPTLAIQLGREGRNRAKTKYDHRASAERIVTMLQRASV